jgi:hypothetical protein
VAELQAVTLNDTVLAEREQGILSINRTVRHATSPLPFPVCLA